GEWVLGVRLTGPQGRAIAFEAVPADVPQSPKTPQLKETAWERLLEAGDGTGGPLAQLARRLLFAQRAGQREAAVAWTHQWVQLAPRGLLARLALQEALWSKNELGKAADLLTELNSEAGEAFLYLRLQQSRFWQRQGFRQKARGVLVAARGRHP